MPAALEILSVQKERRKEKIKEQKILPETKMKQMKRKTDIREIYLTIKEGRFHQVKRMFRAVGKEVVYLKRIQFGTLTLDPSLKPGQYRKINRRRGRTIMLTGKKSGHFDMDGSLVDSMWIWPEVDRIYMDKYHLTAPDTFHRDIEGMSYVETAQYFVDTFTTLNQTVEDVMQEWRDMTVELYATKVFPKAGAVEFWI